MPVHNFSEFCADNLHGDAWLVSLKGAMDSTRDIVKHLGFL